MANDVKVLKYVFENQSRTCFKWKQNRFKILGNRKVHTVNWKKKTTLLVFVLQKKNPTFFKSSKYIYVLYMYVGEDYLLYLLTTIPHLYSLEPQAMVNKRMK